MVGSGHSILALQIRPLFGRVRTNRHCVNFVTHQLAEATVNQLMTRERTKTCEFVADDDCLVVGMVVANDLDFCLWQACFDQARYFVRIHGLPEFPTCVLFDGLEFMFWQGATHDAD